MCTRRLNSTAAMLPPIIAAAMLSRKDEITNTPISMTKPPFQSSGKTCGSTSGTRLFSKWSANKAKPTSSPSRLVSVTHSWPMWPSSPSSPAPVLKPVNSHWYSVMAIAPVAATRSVCWWYSATPSNTSANKPKSSGTPTSIGRAAAVPAMAVCGRASRPSAGSSTAPNRCGFKRSPPNCGATAMLRRWSDCSIAPYQHRPGFARAAGRQSHKLEPPHYFAAPQQKLLAIPVATPILQSMLQCSISAKSRLNAKLAAQPQVPIHLFTSGVTPCPS